LNRPLAGVLVAGLLLGGLALAGIRACPFFVLTGIPCPGCGMVRAVIALITLRFADAWQLHPLVFIAAPAGAVEVLYLAVPTLPRWRYPKFLIGAAVVAALTVWGVRMATGTHPDAGEFSQGLLFRAWVSLRALLSV
jgi:hypothetical protein